MLQYSTVTEDFRMLFWYTKQYISIENRITAKALPLKTNSNTISIYPSIFLTFYPTHGHKWLELIPAGIHWSQVADSN